MPIRLAALAVLLSLAAQASALDTIYLIRHAEKEKDWPRARELNSMQPLDAEGMARASRWATLFAEREPDGGLAAVYCSPTTRSLHTGLPVAKACGAELLSSDATISTQAMPAFLDGLREKFADRHAVLIVGHSNTVPLLLRALGVGEECDAELGISEQSYGPGFEGNAGLWTVDLSKSGCESASWREYE